MKAADAATGGLVAAVREELGKRCALRTEEILDAPMIRALEMAAASSGHSSIADYVAAIRAERGASLLQHLLRRITVGETFFFRHADDLAWLEKEVLPELIATHEAAGQRVLRLWSAACSTGEEAYTLAAIALAAAPSGWDVQVLGTDINDTSLAVAREAVYGEWSFRGVDAARRDKWFESAGDGRWRPREALRRITRFEYLNLRDPIVPAIITGTTELDVISCRNVFIYFYPERVAEALERLDLALTDGGCLLLGPSDLFHVGARGPRLISDGSTPHRMRRRDSGAPASDPPPVRAVPRPMPIPVRPLSAPRPVPVPVPAPPAPEPFLLALRAGRFADAAMLAREALSRDPVSVEASRALALALSGAGDAQGALAAWKQFLYLAPTDPAGHLAVGLALHRAGDDAARPHFRAVLQVLRGVPDTDFLPGPDPLPVGWVRSACESLTRYPVASRGGESR